jgi:MoaA/NifB/PqqE/SkfB family radical SAM enzyme
MKDFEELVAGLQTEGRSLVQTMVELTYGCNLRCVHCYNPTHQARGEMDGEQVKRILRELVQEGCLWVGFTGGELLTRRDAIPLMQYARSLGLVVSVVTNATLVTDDVAEQLKELAPYQVDVSLYGATAETYEAVTRVPGSFHPFVQGVDRLRAQNLPILLKLVMMTLNVHELETMRRFAESRGLLYEVFTEIHPRVTGSVSPLAYRLAPEQCFDIWRARAEDSKNAESAPKPVCGNAGALFECLCGKSSAAVTPHGEMNLCLSMHTPRYDLKSGSIAGGWKHLQTVVSDAQAGAQYECGRCEMAVDCTRGTMDGWLEQGRFDGPCLPHFRQIAEMKTEFHKRRKRDGTCKA